MVKAKGSIIRSQPPYYNSKAIGFGAVSYTHLDVYKRQQTLGIDRIRYSPEKSDPEPVVVQEIKAPPAPVSPQEKERERRKLLLDEQNASLKVCERQYSQAAKSCLLYTSRCV